MSTNPEALKKIFEAALKQVNGEEANSGQPKACTPMPDRKANHIYNQSINQVDRIGIRRKGSDYGDSSHGFC